MSAETQSSPQKPRSHRPRASTVFLAAFIAGAAAAIGINRVLDVHLAQRQPRVESEPIFVALRSLPPGSPVTVWDVALRDWPKAMLPAAAMRPHDSFEGMLLKHPLREGQPVLTVQLVKDTSAAAGRLVEDGMPGISAPAASPTAAPQPDLWAPAEAPAAAAPVAAVQPSEPVLAEPAQAEPSLAEPFVAVQPATESIVVESIVAPVELAVTPVGTDVEPGPTVKPSEPVMRYLVVPERVALQADRFFVPENAAQQTLQEAAPQQVASQPPVTSREPTQPTDLQATQRPQQAKRPTTQSTGRKPQPQRSPRSAMQPSENPTMFQSMFPNISAGMSAVEQQLGR